MLPAGLPSPVAALCPPTNLDSLGQWGRIIKRVIDSTREKSECPNDRVRQKTAGPGLGTPSGHKVHKSEWHTYMYYIICCPGITKLHHVIHKSHGKPGSSTTFVAVFSRLSESVSMSLLCMFWVIGDSTFVRSQLHHSVMISYKI